MTAPVMNLEHPSDETLAAFIDDQLKRDEKQAVTRHLAGCGECRTFVLTIHDDMQAMNDEEGNVVPMRPRRSGWRVAAASAAIAAGLLVVFSGPLYDRLWGANMDDLVRASETIEERPGLGRFAASFPYKKPPTRYRAAAPAAGELGDTRRELTNELLDLEEAPWADPHTRAVGYVMAGHTDEGIIRQLREAAQSSEAAKIDLAAALIARGGTKDLEEAVKLSTGDAPAALWNRAAALHEQRNYAKAKAAWQAYLTVDKDSGYAEEARARIAGIDESIRLTK